MQKKLFPASELLHCLGILGGTLLYSLGMNLFVVRIATDSICAIAAALLGGVIGIGTLICALGLGPFITFFDRLISRKLCGLPT